MLESLNELVANMWQVASSTGKAYTFRAPNQYSLVGISNRIHDILGEAFRTSNRSLYFQVIHLLWHTVELATSVIEVGSGAKGLEDRGGIHTRFSIARNACLALEHVAATVNISDEGERQAAFKLALQAIHITERLAFAPLWRTCDHPMSDEAIAGEFAFELVSFSTSGARRELSDIVRQLNSMQSETVRTKESMKKAMSELVDLDASLSELKLAISRMERTQSDSAILLEVIMPVVVTHLNTILTQQINTGSQMFELCKMMGRNAILLERIDEALSDRLEELRSDVKELVRAVENSITADEQTKGHFISQLHEIAQFSSAGKTVTSIPLIPGFLSYVTESGVNLDWNKWFQKLASLFSSKDK